MRNLEFLTYRSYFNYLNSHPNEINIFLDKFTINYTYFFRNLDVFDKLKDFIIDYKRKKINQNQPIYIWSCGCATGEEPYSIAMMCDKLAKSISNFPEFEIIASDIDKNAIDLARTGIYGEYSIHDTPQYYLNTYFKKTDTPIGSKYSIGKIIKEKVKILKKPLTQLKMKNRENI